MPTKKPFTSGKRRKLLYVGQNTSSVGPQFERTQLRKERLKQYLEQRDLFSSNIKVSDEMRKNPKLELYLRLRKKAEAKDFQKQKELLKKTIRFTEKQRQIAQDKAKLVLENRYNVIRLDNLARMLSEMTLDDSFHGFQATIGQRGTFMTSIEIAPEDVINYFSGPIVSKITDWFDLAKYTAVAYFDPKVFDATHYYHDGYRWGRIRNNVKRPIIAVQVMHWDPKVLAGFTKGMLKVTPDNPIAVFDLYGNVFFP